MVPDGHGGKDVAAEDVDVVMTKDADPMESVEETEDVDIALWLAVDAVYVLPVAEASLTLKTTQKGTSTPFPISTAKMELPVPKLPVTPGAHADNELVEDKAVVVNVAVVTMLDGPVVIVRYSKDEEEE